MTNFFSTTGNTAKTTSIWEGTAPKEPEFPQFMGDIDTDVVIIGGGISGITTALLLSNADKKVTLLEARKIGLGTTGNSTGNLYAIVDEPLSTIRKKWDNNVVKEVVKSRLKAIQTIEENVKKYAIDCNFIRTSFNYFAQGMTEDISNFINKEFEVLAECGLNPQFSDNTALPFKVDKVITIYDQAQFHPLKYVRGLASVVQARCTIHENSPVTGFDAARGIVKTEHGTVKAKSIVMATHTPKGLFLVQTVLGPYREFGIAAELIGPGMDDGIFWSLDEPKHSIRTYSENGKRFVMVIGDKFKTGHHGNSEEYIKNLEKYLRLRFDIGEVNYIWAGQQYRPADGLPYIGQQQENLYFLTGFATDGLVYGTLGAMIVSDLILGNKNTWQDLYKADRHTPLKSAKDFIAENLDNTLQLIKDNPWNADVKALEEIIPGEGKTIEIQGEKLAVYRDSVNIYQAVSALCTHMKCTVKWNQSEKTWDCPCHGSRFAPDGSILEGPALTNLPSKHLTGENS